MYSKWDMHELVTLLLWPEGYVIYRTHVQTCTVPAAVGTGFKTVGIYTCIIALWFNYIIIVQYSRFNNNVIFVRTVIVFSKAAH